MRSAQEIDRTPKTLGNGFILALIAASKQHAVYYHKISIAMIVKLSMLTFGNQLL